MLIGAGAELNIGLPGGRDKGMFAGHAVGVTPLMIAAREGNLELVNRLLAAGADWRLKDAKGKTAVTLATQAGRVDVLQRLEQAGAKVNFRSKQLHSAALLEAVKRQDIEGVRRALERDAGTNLQEKNTQRTPLMLACLDGHAGIVRLLLEAQADPNEHTTAGRIPVDERRRPRAYRTSSAPCSTRARSRTSSTIPALCRPRSTTASFLLASALWRMPLRAAMPRSPNCCWPLGPT